MDYFTRSFGKYLCFVLLLLGCSGKVIQAQPEELMESHLLYRESTLQDRRFKHEDIKKLVLNLPDSLFKVEVAGTSIEGREIYHVETGTGKTKVLLWSQMHGNEPTATMALFDIFNFLIHDHSALRNYILDNLNLHFIPMLNPDGADAFKRRNALDIDINRDALRLQSPESQTLKKIRDQLQPTWGFNLHDQNRYTSAGPTENTASISFLAPAYNEAKEWNTSRTDAMQLISRMNEILQKLIPGKVGRYSDEFEPRAFGDNIQKWGTNTILIETGALLNDPEKQYLRQLNYVSLLSAFQSIADQSYENYSLQDYEQIPYNRSFLHDLIVRNARLKMFDQYFLFDIGLRLDEIQDQEATDFYLKAYISDLGDLHNYYGYEEFNAEGYDVQYEKLYSTPFDDLSVLKKKGISGLLEKGYTTFILKSMPSADIASDLPFRIIAATTKYISPKVITGSNPVLTFWKNGTLESILVNGKISTLKEINESLK